VLHAWHQRPTQRTMHGFKKFKTLWIPHTIFRMTVCGSSIQSNSSSEDYNGDDLDQRNSNE
jgi:hypothetical protein